jgi:hypothetical protein
MAVIFYLCEKYYDVKIIIIAVHDKKHITIYLEKMFYLIILHTVIWRGTLKTPPK